MLILCVRTDKPCSELYLHEDDVQIGRIKWEAHRALVDTLHQKIKELASECDKNISDIEKIVVFKGPGSFTGLRIGVSVANALAYGLRVPIVGAEGDEWIDQGVKIKGDLESVQPQYGREAHITQPRK